MYKRFISTLIVHFSSTDGVRIVQFVSPVYSSLLKQHLCRNHLKRNRLSSKIELYLTVSDEAFKSFASIVSTKTVFSPHITSESEIIAKQLGFCYKLGSCLRVAMGTINLGAAILHFLQCTCIDHAIE